MLFFKSKKYFYRIIILHHFLFYKNISFSIFFIMIINSHFRFERLYYQKVKLVMEFGRLLTD